MSTPHHISRHHRAISISYARSLRQRIYSFVVVPLGVLLISIFFIHTFGATSPTQPLSPSYIFSALGVTFLRLGTAYIVALALSLPLALLVTRSALAEHIFLPLFDIMQSLPVLAFFPVVIVFFVHYGLYNSAAIFILFLAMLWNLVFSLVGGLRVIPADIKAVGHIFGVRGFAYLRKILLPSTLPYLITGSLLAWAQGWNIIIVAEVLHTYLPGGTESSDLFGIGSILVHASAAGQQQTFLLAIAIMTIAVAFLNLFMWQKLLTYAERFKFE